MSSVPWTYSDCVYAMMPPLPITPVIICCMRRRNKVQEGNAEMMSHRWRIDREFKSERLAQKGGASSVTQDALRRAREARMAEGTPPPAAYGPATSMPVVATSTVSDRSIPGFSTPASKAPELASAGSRTWRNSASLAQRDQTPASAPRTAGSSVSGGLSSARRGKG